VRFAFIEAEKARYSVRTLCRLLGVTRSGFYAWCKRDESPRAIANRRLGVEIRSAFEANRRAYGSPRIYHELRAAGGSAGRHRIARLMRQHGLQARRKRRFIATTDSRHDRRVARNLVRREFEVAQPNRVWAGDVTFIPTSDGWLYLAVLLDLCSRRVVGWAMSARNDESLVLDALRMALEQRCPAPGLVVHSDRGTTYAGGGYQAALSRAGARCSMSRRGNCWDNAVVESFFSSLKTETAIGQSFASRALARQLVFDYIECFYNRTRRHSTLDYLSPESYEQSLIS
jgi:transposase InsO family protein